MEMEFPAKIPGNSAAFSSLVKSGWLPNGYGNCLRPRNLFFRSTKIFLWRACRNYIPTRGNLARRHIPIEPRCRFSGFETENTTHSLIFCPLVEEAWTNSPFETILDQRQDQDLWETITHATKPLTLDNLGLLAIMAWEIWSCRNKLIHEERKPDMAAIFNKAVSLSDNYAPFNLSHVVAALHQTLEA